MLVPTAVSSRRSVPTRGRVECKKKMLEKFYQTHRNSGPLITHGNGALFIVPQQGPVRFGRSRSGKINFFSHRITQQTTAGRRILRGSADQRRSKAAQQAHGPGGSSFHFPFLLSCFSAGLATFNVLPLGYHLFNSSFRFHRLGAGSPV